MYHKKTGIGFLRTRTMMMAEQQYKELMALTEQIKREEINSEEKWKMVETVRAKLQSLLSQTKEQIEELDALRETIEAVIEGL